MNNKSYMGHGVLKKSFPWNEVLKTFKLVLGSFLISQGILFMTELRRPVGPPGGAIYHVGVKEKRKPILNLPWWLSVLATGLVDTYDGSTTTTTAELLKISAILQLLGKQKHAALVYGVFYGIGHPVTVKLQFSKQSIPLPVSLYLIACSRL